MEFSIRMPAENPMLPCPEVIFIDVEVIEPEVMDRAFMGILFTATEEKPCSIRS